MAKTEESIRRDINRLSSEKEAIAALLAKLSPTFNPRKDAEFLRELGKSYPEYTSKVGDLL